MPRLASSTPARVDQPTGSKKSAKAGSATASATTRKASVAIPLANQIALRSTGASTSPSSRPCSRSATNARPRPSSAVKRIATQSSPSSASRDEPVGSAKWNTTRIAITNSSIAGSVSRARSSRRRSLPASVAVSPRYRDSRAGEAGPASSGRPRKPRLGKREPPAGERRDPVGIVRGDEDRPALAHPGKLTVEQFGARFVQAAERLVEDQQLGLVQERAAEGESLQLAARELGRPLAPRVPEGEALEQHPDPLAPLGHAVEPPVEVEVLERG